MTSIALAPKPAPEHETGLLEVAKAAIRARVHDGPTWLEARRSEAAARLEANGFPRWNDEAWRFTPTRDVTRLRYALRTADISATVRDGTGVEVLRLSEAKEKIEPFLGRVAALEDGFSSLNGALWSDGIVVFAARGARGRVEITRAAGSSDSTLVLPRVLVLSDRESELTLVESYSGGNEAGPHLVVPVTEIVVGEGARVEHVRIHDGTAGTASIATVAVRQERSSRYASRVFTFGGVLSRLDLRVALSGEGAECVLDGLYVARAGEVVDHHTTIDHLVPHCSSRERYKGALDGSGTAVFDGTILVRHGALQTEAHQENRNLLLSGNAVVHSKPHLRIDTDDVKCSHGATVGRLDPAQLFYLRSRGLGADVARSVLTYAFLSEMTTTAPEDLRAALGDRIAALFPDGAVAKELV